MRLRRELFLTGASVPEQVITNDDLSKLVDTSDEWITQRTGIKKRHISGGENTSHFAINTARQVLERAEVAAEDVDLIIVAKALQPTMEHRHLHVWYKKRLEL